MNKEINDYFISVLRNQVRIQDFEYWIYNNDEFLEETLGEQTYFKIINLNYSSKFVIDELEPLLIKILDFRSIEDFKIRDLLNRMVFIEEDLISSCREIYREYCNGYSFLKYIVYDYDFQLDIESNRKEFEKDRKEYIEEGKRLLEFFNSGKLEIIGEQEYIDLRIEEERIEEKYWT
ncbi:hypothetical protein GC093_04810 [Paenibacillus sp. LMG 31456]|uniref:DUF4375 domain-containing protein n=1 Tax=Paenibacillus foliorum TaxID=2654974 RepID=A0A972GRM4_9BACL|nr:hypothetical protein [Paenibacillus foliorum]NOU92552.1 hypothetical protein [Paenibacillus foliorum]